MKYPFFKALISFILLVCSAAVLVYGLLFLQTSPPETPMASTEKTQPAVESGAVTTLTGSDGATPSGGVQFPPAK